MTGPGGGGVPRLRGTCRDPGKGGDIKQHKVWKKLLEGPTKEMKENRSRYEEPERHRKDPKKERSQIQMEKVGKKRKPQSPRRPGRLGKMQDNAGDCPEQQELARIRTTWRIERLYGRGQGGGQKWEALDRAATRDRGKTAGTMADGVDKAPQSRISPKKLVEDPTKKMKESWSRSGEPENPRKDNKKECRQSQPEKAGKERKPQSQGHPGPLGKLQDEAGDCSGQQELARIRTI